MGDAKLRELLDEAPLRQSQFWIRRQQVAARKLLIRLSIFARDSNIPREISDLTVVAEAIFGIKSEKEGYVWNGKEDFDFFFFECMKKSINNIRREYRKSKYISPLTLDSPEALSVSYRQDLIEPRQNEIESKAVSQVAARAVAAKRLRANSKTASYLMNVPKYVDENATPEEIRKHLILAEATYRQFHNRVSRLVDEFGGEDK